MDGNELRGQVAGIRRAMIHDGPGIRTVVFLKGCPLRCRWCSSPQTWNENPNLLYLEKKCIGCGACVGACPEGALSAAGARTVIDRAACTSCGRCVEVCPTEALRFDSVSMSVGEVVGVVEKDAHFYAKSGGGVTVSGGEPCVQAEFLIGILVSCRERGIHTAIETTGFAEPALFDRVLAHTDLLLFDIKHLDSARHLELTGRPNGLILENIARAARGNKTRIIVHVPLIPGMNDSREHIDGVLDFASNLGIREMDVLPFHKLGSHEYEELGIDYPMKDRDVPGQDRVDEYRALIRARGFRIAG